MKKNGEWVHKWSNLKHLYDALTIFLVEECGQKLPLFSAGGRSRPDLKAIAQHASLPDTVLLLKLCVVAAINCGDRIEYLKRMQALGEATQEVLMTTVQEAGEVGSDEDEENDGDQHKTIYAEGSNAVSSARNVDLDLASEERLANVIADNQRIAFEKREVQRQLDDLYARYEKLQVKSDRSQEELGEANDRLTALLSGKGDGAQSKTAEAQTEAIIAALEARSLQAETENEELRKTNEVLKIKADRVQKLQDDYDEIKIERDKLSRKANTAEKYRQKLESIQDIERENQSLKSKVSELQNQIRQDDSSQASTANLQREIDEYRRLLPSIEQERYDLNEMKKRLEFDYHTLQARWHELSDEHQRSQNTIEDLQGRLREYEDGSIPTTPTKAELSTAPDLEVEEADFAEAEARLTQALLDSSNNNTSDKSSEEQSGISEDELRAIMAAMRAQAQAGSASERESGMQAQKKLLIALDRQRTRNLSLTDHIKKQSELIKELKENEEQQKQTPEPRIPPSIPQSKLSELLQTNENLKREIKLMTSAWYEQNQRIAASSASGGAAVSLMRSKMGRTGGGVEEPRSFLGRQRRVIDNVVLGGGSGAGGGVQKGYSR